MSVNDTGVWQIYQMDHGELGNLLQFHPGVSPAI